jgi:deoxyribonuclease IV
MMIAGGLPKAVAAGADAGCEVIQIFTKSPQQWKAKALTEEDARAFREAQDAAGIPCVAAHDTYLINPASADPDLLARSRAAMVDELQRASLLGVPYLVMHLVSVGDEPEEAAMGRLIESVQQALASVSEGDAALLLETTAGQGKSLGHRFEHIAAVLGAVDANGRLGVCLDTCHIFAAGYDLRTPEAVAQTLDGFGAVVGFEHLKLVHANDSVRELGSRVDRHAHIGRGEIGAEGFRAFLRDPRIAAVPFILETPKAGNMDPVNLAALRELSGCGDWTDLGSTKSTKGHEGGPT